MFQSNDFKLNGVTLRGLARECKNDFCFVAGTLVHTDKGLVPIEQLKVGDIVLSKHESGEGDNAYKKVTKTFKSAEKMPIMRVEFRRTGDSSSGAMYLFCTDNHPFWSMVQDDTDSYLREWTWNPASNLTFHGYMKDINGNELLLTDSGGYMAKTNEPGIGYCIDGYRFGIRNYDGGISMFVDFRSGKPILIAEEKETELHWFYRSDWDSTENIMFFKRESHEEKFYRSAYLNSKGSGFIEKDINIQDVYMDFVYNIEVEDFHTYYVGTAGVWVYNTNCAMAEQA